MEMPTATSAQSWVELEANLLPPQMQLHYLAGSAPESKAQVVYEATQRANANVQEGAPAKTRARTGST